MEQSSRSGSRLVWYRTLFAVSSVLTVVAGILARSQLSWTRWAFTHGAYYVILCLVFAFLAHATRGWDRVGAGPREFWRAHRWEIGFCFVLTALCFVATAWDFRVYSDETNFVGVSRAMTFERRTDFLEQSRHYYLNSDPVNRVWDKRPLLFPFGVQLIHSLTGYRPENAFVFNALTLFSLLLLLQLAFRRRAGIAWGYAAALMAVSQPMLVQSATSGGSDLLYVFLLCASGVQFLDLMDTPDSERLTRFLLILALMVNARIESAIPALVLFGGLLLLRRIKLSWLLGSDAEAVPSSFQALLPLCLLPLIWQRVLIPDYSEGYAGPTFALQYLRTNLSELMKALNPGDLFFPFAGAYVWLGLAALVWLAIRAARGSWPSARTSRQSFFVLVLAGLGTTLIYLTYYWGQPTHPASARFYGAPILGLGIAFVAALAATPGLRERRREVLLALGLGFAMYHPLAHEGRFSNNLHWRREHLYVRDFLRKRLATDIDILLIGDKPNQYTIYEVGAMQFSAVRANPGIIRHQMERHLIGAVYAIQEVSYATGLPLPAQDLSSEFRFEPMLERQLTADSFLRISRLHRI